jgi:sugar lactone lactonase YvrE
VASLNFPQGVAVDPQGNIYIADTFNHRIRRVDGRTGIITTIAGTGTLGFAGDGGPAQNAQLATPTALGLDAAGNLYVLDRGNRRVRRIEAETGIIRTVAGSGESDFSGDAGPATLATFNNPRGLAVAPDRTLYIADTGNHRIRRVDATTGIITTVAGSGVAAFAGDGGPGALAQLSFPQAVALDAAGNLYLIDGGNHRVRRMDGQTGAIATVAGTGDPGFSGDGGPATLARLNTPQALALDRAGGLYLADGGNDRVRRVELASGLIRTVGGTGRPGFSGDGGPAMQAQLANPQALAVDTRGNVFVADTFNDRVRRIEAGSNAISTVGGSGAAGLVGDGGPAIEAQLASPNSVALDASGNRFIADKFNFRVRRIDARTGTITTVAGTGEPGSVGDGGPATQAQLSFPAGLALDAAGNLFIADSLFIRHVDVRTGVITTVAGTRVLRSLPGDGGPATQAKLGLPEGLALDASGNLFIADRQNHRIRRIEARTGIITTVAGTGERGFSGDGGPATEAQLASPSGVGLEASGNLFIADTGNNRVRRINARTGIITTVAGTGEVGFPRDGGPATQAPLSFPAALALDTSGNLLIADTFNGRVRRVDVRTGIITTVAGTGQGFSGDGGPAAQVQLSFPEGLAFDASGNFFIADRGNDRVRRVDAGTGVITTVAGTRERRFSGDGGPATQAQLAFPAGLALDVSGNLFVADSNNQAVRRWPARGTPASQAMGGWQPRLGSTDPRPSLSPPRATSTSRTSTTPASAAWTRGLGSSQRSPAWGRGSRVTAARLFRRGSSFPRASPWTPQATCSSPKLTTIGSDAWRRRQG